MTEGAAFLGFDHIDTRVPSLAAVEPFYDALMPLLGLPRKRASFVDDAGEWHAQDDDGGYNTIEYLEAETSGRTACFIGFIERRETPPTLTRIAVRVPREDMETWGARLASLGARNIEPSADMQEYPAIFFEDPAGTKLELVARAPTP